jgi:hypothetical protein
MQDMSFSHFLVPFDLAPLAEPAGIFLVHSRGQCGLRYI